MRLNNKGYMLVEIIISFTIAMGIAFYLMNLTFKFKNVNEDIYQSILYLKEKELITKNIMYDLEKGNITYEFQNMEYKHFEIIEVDITNLKSPEEILNNIDLKDDIYRIVLNGERNVDIEKIKEILKATEKNICEIRDYTHTSYDFEKIATEQNLKGFFTKKMLDEIKEKPEQKEEILKAIEITYQLL